ncbi:hypothetical protein NDA13_004865 [Ustilago tritici]|nr:hypothetical protein NDA13_004865 [Ustilago tritici]
MMLQHLFCSAASLLLVLFLSTTLVSAIKFDLPAATHPHTKCIWNYALSDSLVIITASTIAKEPFDFSSQRVDVEVVDGSKHSNVYLSKKNIKGETRLAINTHSHADLGVCFKNTQTSKIGSNVPVMTIDLDVDIGADAVDYNAIANQESLSGLETEVRKLEAVANEIVNEMEYLKKRELRMADTNLSTNMRVTNFAILTLVALVALGVWQVFHLRNFFKRKYLID